MTASKVPTWERRAARVRAHLNTLAGKTAASYSPDQRRRFAPFVLSPGARRALRQLEEQLLPLPPDGKTKLQRDHEAQLRKWTKRMKLLERMKLLPAVKIHMRVTSGRRKILDALSSGVKLEVQFAGQYNDVAKLRSEGLIERVAHPRVKDRRTGYPADGLQLTTKGRSFLADLDMTATKAKVRP